MVEESALECRPEIFWVGVDHAQSQLNEGCNLDGASHHSQEFELAENCLGLAGEPADVAGEKSPVRSWEFEAEVAWWLRKIKLPYVGVVRQ